MTDHDAGPDAMGAGSTGPDATSHDGTDLDVLSHDGLANDEDKDEAGKSPLRVTLEWAAILVGALVVALVVRSVLFQAYHIRHTSMLPTVGNGDQVLVNRLSYNFNDINRGDLVVFNRPPELLSGQKDDLIKRVVALPGETIQFVDGQVYIDNQRLHEPYLSDTTITAPGRLITCEIQVPNGCQIPEDQVFVMGDNRGNSVDSRNFGSIDEDLIVGRAFLRIWPFNGFGWL